MLDVREADLHIYVSLVTVTYTCIFYFHFNTMKHFPVEGGIRCDLPHLTWVPSLDSDQNISATSLLDPQKPPETTSEGLNLQPFVGEHTPHPPPKDQCVSDVMIVPPTHLTKYLYETLPHDTLSLVLILYMITMILIDVRVYIL